VYLSFFPTITVFYPEQGGCFIEKMNMEDLNRSIDNQKADVERVIIRDRENKRTVRKRKRDADEEKILDKICIKRWKDAERDGKIKYITKRKWYYEFD
jgi:hypothetical protein